MLSTGGRRWPESLGTRPIVHHLLEAAYGLGADERAHTVITAKIEELDASS